MSDVVVVDVLRTALGAHGIFKAQLIEAIERGDWTSFAAARAGRDDLCNFGKWIHQEVPPSLRNSPHYPSVVALHAEFHKVVAAALQLADQGKKSEGVELVKHATTPLTLELMAWIKDHG